MKEEEKKKNRQEKQEETIQFLYFCTQRVKEKRGKSAKKRKSHMLVLSPWKTEKYFLEHKG